MNRTVLITGAAVRIGRAIAEALAARSWRVIVHAHRSAAQAGALCAHLQTLGCQAWQVTGDLLSPEGPDAVFDAALAAAGHVDALVNNASLFARQPLASAVPADFERLWRINTLAPARLTQRLAAHLLQRQATGCAVNLLDQRIAQSGCAGATPYLLSKKALEAFTLSAALELAPGVRVNGVAPGAVLAPEAADAKEPAGRFPLRVRPTAAQVAEAVAFLLDAPAITGQILFVDGGQHLLS
jgi:NAD(P)-dependent dehydrogenase (short-subunit alcohol dehydrogenase family)